MVRLQKKNYLHLDLKGIVPKPDAFRQWLVFFRNCGFEGIVLECDGRVAFDTWPGAGDGFYSKQDIRELVEYAEALGLEVIPLIQTLGHLEWLLKEERYASLRENNCISEICLSYPQTTERLKTWIDEVLALTPLAKMIHLGGDETTRMGSCDKCRGRGTELFVRHMSELCNYVYARGVRPVLWSDYFRQHHEVRQELFAELILVDWNYQGGPPYRSTGVLEESGYEVWGASAVQCAWYEHMWTMLNIPAVRLENVIGWNRTEQTVIHTTWGRPGSIWNLYPSWYGSIPVFIAAGNPEAWSRHPWYGFYEKLSPALRINNPVTLKQLHDEVNLLPGTGEIEAQALKHLELALRFQIMLHQAQCVGYGRRCLKVTASLLGRDQQAYYEYCTEPAERLRRELSTWRRDTRDFFQRNHLSNGGEFVAEKSAAISSAFEHQLSTGGIHEKVISEIS